MKNPYIGIHNGMSYHNPVEVWELGRASLDAEVSEHHIVIKNLRAALVAEHKKLAEQAEIVSELVGALDGMMEYTHYRQREIPITDAEKRAWVIAAERAIAKAKGED